MAIHVALRENETINKLLAQFNSNLETGDNFGPEDFTYNNSKMLKLMLDNIIDTDFIGLTVNSAAIELDILSTAIHTYIQ